MKSTTTTLKHLGSRLDEQLLEAKALRAAIEVLTRRINQMEAEQDLWPHSPELKRVVRELSAELPSGNGHHRSHR